MKVIANYGHLGDVAVGETLPLWGVTCVLTNVGTADEPAVAYVAEVSDEEGKALIETGRFREAPAEPKEPKAGKKAAE